jgi:iron complex outermembrane recepter protein
MLLSVTAKAAATRADASISSSRTLRTFALAITCALSMTIQAADDTPKAADQSDPSQIPSAAVSSETEGDVEEVVVTGSRLVRAAGYTAPTPVTVLSTESLAQKAPTSLPDALNQIPVFQGSISNSQDRNSTSNRVRTGNYLNLRSLGPQRVLVLQDGMRLPPTGNAGGTDANMIPQMLIERIEVVTGGASAAYGSDAVSGVVNFIVDKNFEGLKLQGQGGISSRSDNDAYRAGAAYGRSLFDGRMHLTFSAETSHTDGIKDKSTRKLVNEDWAVIGAGTAADPFRNVTGVKFNTGSDGGYISSGPAALIRQQFLPDGSVGPFDPGAPTGRAGLGFGGDGYAFAHDSTLVAASTTNQFFGRMSFDLGNDMEAFVQASFSTAKNWDAGSSSASTGSGGPRIFAENAFLDPAVRALFGTTPSIQIGRNLPEYPNSPVEQRTRALIANAGISGSLGDSSFKWDFTYSYGRTRFNNETIQNNNIRYYAAVDAVVDPASGQIVCRVTLTNPTTAPGCVPINLIGAGSITQEALDYVLGVSTWESINDLHDVQFSVTGEPFSTWAGPVATVVGAEYRHQSLDQTSNSDTAVTLDPAALGLRGVPVDTRIYGTSVSFATGSYDIKELFTEVSVPLAKDAFLAKSLELNGAFRYTDYSTSGAVKTWKLGSTYEPGGGVRFRATLSRDIRAPTLYELYSGESLRGQSYSDRLTNTLTGYSEVNRGNPDLQPEIGNTFTGGIVFQPTFLSGFAISADYYRIKIKNAIASQFTSIQVLDQCANSNYTSPLCAQVIRYPDTNLIRRVNIFQTNVSSIQNEGVDLETSFRTDLAGGQFSARILGTRLLSYTTQGNSAAPTIEYAGVADFSDVGGIPFPMPKWRGNLDLNYTRGGFTVSAQERYIGSYKRSHLFVYAENDIPSIAYTDLNLSMELHPGNGPALQVYTTINNLFDKDYPLVPLSANPGLPIATFRSIYDVVGRYYTLGVRAKF